MSSAAFQERRLVFLTVNSSFSHSSLALPLLHSACRDLTRWEWSRYDMTLKDDPVAAARAIAEQNCDLLVTDLYLFNRVMALDVLQRVHALDPACRMAVGGPECLGEGAEELLRFYPWLDAVFRGEGETLFHDYLADFDRVPGSQGRIFPAEGNGVFMEWASSPFPGSDPFFVTDKPFVQLETSRGCPMQCFYCTSGGTRTRYRTLEQVRAELTLLADKGVSDVRVLDRTFNLPQERGAALLRMFREEFPGIRFHLELHPQFLGTLLREELALARPRQLHIEAGIQCLDPEVMQLCGRRSDPAAVLDGLAFLCRQTAFETHADLLAGLPGQTWAHILADAASLIRLEVGEIQLEVLKSLPGTPLRTVGAAYGLCYSGAAPYDVMKSSTLAMKEMQWARDLSRLLDMTYNHPALHEAVLAMAEECIDFVPRLLAFFHRSNGDAAVLWDLKKRFLFLRDFCGEYQLTQAPCDLAYGWLLAGFPPGQGADVYSRKADGIGDGAEWCAGDTACLEARETRYYRLSRRGQMYFLAYNRAFAPNRPAAIWRKPAAAEQ